MLAFVVGAATLGAGPASAARPVKGARYIDADNAGFFGHRVKLQVSRSGRWLSPRHSSVSNVWGDADNCRNLDVHLGSRRRPVRIRPSGRFRYVRRRGSFVLRLRGRFTTENRARIRFRYRREPRRRSHPCNDSGRISLSPQRIRQLPFRDCQSHEAKTVLLAPTGRVFWQFEWDGTEWIEIAYACLFSANRRFKLHEDEDDDSDLHDFRLVGPYLAYAWHPCAEGCLRDDVEVRDLRDGKLARRGPTSAGGHEGAITDLELKDNGSVAVIAYSYPPDRAREVWAYDTLGARRLDRGDISPRSLVLEGSTLSWVKDGVVRSATLE
jgi:hypothetical protein